MWNLKIRDRTAQNRTSGVDQVAGCLCVNIGLFQLDLVDRIQFIQCHRHMKKSIHCFLYKQINFIDCIITVVNIVT